jgi:alkanesulfonate monooxygenase SsuD/methylene tetrahydromethanopterin reductase-like flavin-dependent oxidoreductase (luciferase family)
LRLHPRPIRLARAAATLDTEPSAHTEDQRMPLSFGVTVLPDPPASRLVELMQLGEQNGFEIGWTYDSHVLWQESFVQLTMAIQATSRM